MTIRTLLDRFDLLMDTPESVSNLRRFILRLAVEGRLTIQKTEESASSLLNRIQSRKQKLLVENDSPRRKSLGEMPNDFPFDLPQNWTWTRLDDVCPYIQRGKRPDYSEREEIPVVSQKCVQWDGFKSGRVRFIDPESLDKYQSYRFLKKGDLLWNSTGVGTVGRVNVYRGELDEYPRVVADSHVTVVRPIKEMVLPEYIYCWIGSTHVQSKVETEMTSGTTKQTELNTSTVRRTLLPLPPVEEQQRIVETVDRLMDECDVLEQKQERERTLQVQVGTAATEALQSADDAEALRPAWERVHEHFDTVTATPEGVDALRQTILQLAVQGRLTERDPDDTPADVLLERIQKEKQRLYDAGEIRKPKTVADVDESDKAFAVPSSWTWTRLNEIALGLRYGYTASAKEKEEGVRFLRITDIQDNSVDWTEVPSCEIEDDEIEKYRIREGDLLVARTGGTIGKTFLMPEVPVDAVCASYLIRIRPSPRVSSSFVKRYLESPLYWRQLNEASSGTGQPNVNSTALRELVVPLPPPEEQRRIVNTISRLLPVCKRLDEYLEEMSEYGEQLLEAALRDVSVDQQPPVPTSATA